MGIKFFYHTGVSHGNFAGWYATFNPSGDVKRGVYCDGAVQCRQPEKGGSPASNRNPDADKLIGNYELLEKMTWMEPWPTQNPERRTHRRPIIESILPSLCNVSKKKFEVPNMGDMTCCRVRFSCNGRKRAESRAGDSRSIVADVSTSETCGADECPEIAARDCDRFFRDAENRLL